MSARLIKTVVDPVTGEIKNLILTEGGPGDGTLTWVTGDGARGKQTTPPNVVPEEKVQAPEVGFFDDVLPIPMQQGSNDVNPATPEKVVQQVAGPILDWFEGPDWSKGPSPPSGFQPPAGDVSDLTRLLNVGATTNFAAPFADKLRLGKGTSTTTLAGAGDGVSSRPSVAATDPWGAAKLAGIMFGAIVLAVLLARS